LESYHIMEKEFKSNKIFLLALLAIFAVPVIMNFTIPLVNPWFDIYGNDNNWFSFWSSYSGSVISGLITLVVLYKILKQNQNNHIKQLNHSDNLNRSQKAFQVKLMQNQLGTNRLDELRTILTENLDILFFGNVEDLSNKISIISSNKSLIDEITFLKVKIRNCKTRLLIHFHNKSDSPFQKLYITQIEQMTSNLNKVLDSFLKYLLSIEKIIVDMPTRLDNFKDLEPKPEQLALLVQKKEEGYKVNQEKRDNIFTILKENRWSSYAMY